MAHADGVGEMIIPCDYEKIFEDRLLLLTGVGRSGTTILGKLLGSMTPAYLVFEPTLFKMISPLSQGFFATLFEDYFRPVIHGRGNWNSQDWDSIHNQLSFAEIMDRWKNMRRRSDCMKLIEQEKPLFIVKSLEYQGYFWKLKKALPSVRYLEIIRSGYDVVRSSVERGWFTDQWCNHEMIQRCFENSKCRIPDYVDVSDFSYDDEIQNWPNWSPWTKAACAWRCLILQGRENSSIDINYQTLISAPQATADFLSERFGLKQTALTEKFIFEILNHRPTKREPFDLNLIEQPERDRFVEANEKLGHNP